MQKERRDGLDMLWRHRLSPIAWFRWSVFRHPQQCRRWERQIPPERSLDGAPRSSGLLSRISMKLWLFRKLPQVGQHELPDTIDGPHRTTSLRCSVFPALSLSILSVVFLSRHVRHSIWFSGRQEWNRLLCFLGPNDEEHVCILRSSNSWTPNKHCPGTGVAVEFLRKSLTLPL
jgi:hypothetical protein